MEETTLLSGAIRLHKHLCAQGALKLLLIFCGEQKMKAEKLNIKQLYISILLLFSACSLAYGETIGIWEIQSAPTSATFQTGDPQAVITWMNVNNVNISISDAFSGMSVIDDGLGNIPSNSIMEMTFAPGTALNVPGNDLVVFEARFTPGSYLISTSYDNYSSSVSILQSNFVFTGLSRAYYYGLNWGPFSAQVWGAPIDLSQLGVPLGQYVDKIRLIATSSGADPLGIGSLSIPESGVPKADAGGPYTIYDGDKLTLNAGGSTDDDNDIVSYLWDLDDDNDFETDSGNEPVLEVDFGYLQSLGLTAGNTYNIHLKATDSKDQNDVNYTTLTILEIPSVQVAVDIKPGSCPNPINLKSRGVLPVAILGTSEFDVATIDPNSIRLAGVEALRFAYEDVTSPASDTNDCNCTKAGPDGFLDLTLKFETQSIAEAIGDVNRWDKLTLELTGTLFESGGIETPIEGTDCILIVGEIRKIPNPKILHRVPVKFQSSAHMSKN